MTKYCKKKSYTTIKLCSTLYQNQKTEGLCNISLVETERYYLKLHHVIPN